MGGLRAMRADPEGSPREAPEGAQERAGDEIGGNRPPWGGGPPAYALRRRNWAVSSGCMVAAPKMKPSCS